MLICICYKSVVRTVYTGNHQYFVADGAELIIAVVSAVIVISAGIILLVGVVLVVRIIKRKKGKHNHAWPSFKVIQFHSDQFNM